MARDVLRVGFLCCLALVLIARPGSAAQGFKAKFKVFGNLPSRLQSSNPVGNQECCVRHRKLVSVGYDISGKEMVVDVGHCSRKCATSSREVGSKTDDFEPPARPLSALDRIRLQMRQRVSGGTGASGGSHPDVEDAVGCQGNGLCEPTRTRVQQLQLMDGPVDVEVIEDCHCAPRPPSCERSPRRKVYFADTPFEAEVDIGVCRGRCSEERHSGCKAVKNGTVTITGPNGKGNQCIDVVKECACAGECYRSSQREVYYEVFFNETAQEFQEREKEIDVGRCLGSCTEGHHRCVMRSEDDPSVCLMSLFRPKGRCAATRFTEHRFISREQKLQSILAIDDCGCK
ncbi:uncharacterized protein [Branchiostoma lanceolatum]|uniref:uncharacterized protein isoform X1 n=1 Tax=Branchiostoma lanceolatum TaxID=7740 RepID=UPI003452FF12